MYFKSNTISIYYEKHGTGEEKILILPGWGNTRNTFYNLINNLKENYTIYIIDYPGFGNSPVLNKELNIYDYAFLINSFIKKMNIDNPIIIAHSFGGRITSILGGYYQIKIKKIILIDVAGIKKRKKLKVFLKEKIYKVLKKCTYLLPKIKQEKYRQKLLLFFGSTDYKSIPPSMQKTFQNIIKEDLRKYYKNISTETLIIWGENDIDTPLKDGILIKKLISNSEIIVYKKSDHFAYLNYPEQTNRIISSFLNNKENL
ncbi:MAG: alpha/beta hydrolase [Bacilli bacterium]|nr:alpha/beta hydrolase [Bacilli bacterium]